MSGEIDEFVWPSASALVRRAEQRLNVARPVAPITVAAGSLAEMRHRLTKFEQGHHSLVPTGYESTGRASLIKRTLKKFIRPLMWWYVEPRWIVQRDLTADLAAFASASILAMDEMVAELHSLRLQVHELEQQLVDRT
jgi:hypothetical protein